MQDQIMMPTHNCLRRDTTSDNRLARCRAPTTTEVEALAA